MQTTNNNKKQNKAQLSALQNKIANQRKALNSQSIPRVTGQGGYYSDNIVPFMRRLIRDGTFSDLGSAAGGMLGASYGPLASKVGNTGGGWLGKKLAQIVGFGDYEVITNSVSTKGGALPEGSQIPAFGTSLHETRVCHREFIKDVLVPLDPQAFTNIAQKINPGNEQLFPWLATIAPSYSQYRFNGLVFEFRTMSSDITAGGALGTVVMATDYDAIDSPYVDKITMENSQYAVSSKPSRSMMHAIECDPSITTQKLYYTRDGSLDNTANSDTRFYDMGLFQIATKGLPGTAGQVMGELWVTYDVSFYKPELNNPNNQSASIKAQTAISKTAVFGSEPIIAGNLFSGITNTVTFNAPGVYALNFILSGTTTVRPLRSVTGGITIVNVAGASSNAGVTFTDLYLVTVPVAGATIVFDASNSATVTYSELRLSSAAPPANYV